MNVIATSQVPAQVPYLHLGYLSAYADGRTGWRQPPGYTGATVIASVGILILVGTLCIFKAWKWRIVGGVIGCLVLALAFFSAIAVAGDPNKHPERVTEGRIIKAYELSYDEKMVNMPEKIGQRVNVIDTVDIDTIDYDYPFYVDGWGHHIAFEKVAEQEYFPLSPGPDGVFDTSDDFVGRHRTFTYPPPKR